MSFKKPNENTKTRPIQTTGTEKEIESKTRRHGMKKIGPKSCLHVHEYPNHKVVMEIRAHDIYVLTSDGNIWEEKGETT